MKIYSPQIKANDTSEYKNASGNTEDVLITLMNPAVNYIRDKVIFEKFLPLIYNKWSRSLEKISTNFNAYIVVNIINTARILQFDLPTGLETKAIIDIELVVNLDDKEEFQNKDYFTGDINKPKFRCRFDKTNNTWQFVNLAIEKNHWLELARKAGEKYNS